MADKSKKKSDPELEASVREIRRPIFPVWGWFLVVAFLIVGLIGVIRSTKVLTTCPYETDALVALRALSNVELAYRDYNEDKRYATLEGLIMNGFVQDGYDEKNIVPGYKFVVTPLSFYDDTLHTFVIRAFPTHQARPCGTFQMGPDRKLYEFLPQISHNIHDSENWLDVSYILNTLPERERLKWMGDNYAYN